MESGKQKKMTFIAALKAAMAEGKEGHDLVASIKAVLPDYDEKRIRARLKTAIKYLGREKVDESASSEAT